MRLPSCSLPSRAASQWPGVGLFLRAGVGEAETDMVKEE